MTTLATTAAPLPALRRSLERVGLGLLPLGVLALLAAESPRRYFWDFRVFWRAGEDVLAGRSPYPAPDAAVLAHQSSFVYPPETALAMAPLSLLPYGLAAAIFFVALVGALGVTLWVLDVRDWRCYGATLLMAPVMSAVANGAISCFLALGVALAWRYRDSWPRAGAVAAAVIIAKVFLWPLALWLVATRRYAAAAAAVGGGIVVTLVSWAALGFAGLTDYVHLLRLLSKVEQAEGFSAVALGLAIGLPETAAHVSAIASGVIALIVMFVVARRRDGDRLALVAALAAAILLSPIVWLHYFVLLLVPLAIARPRFGAAWLLLPLPFWVSSTSGQSHGHGALIALALLTASALLVAGAREREAW